MKKILVFVTLCTFSIFFMGSYDSGCSSSSTPVINACYYNAGNITVELSQSVSATAASKISVRTGGFTGALNSFSLSAPPASTFTITPTSALASGSYYVIFKDGVFDNGSAVSDAAVFVITVP